MHHVLSMTVVCSGDIKKKVDTFVPLVELPPIQKFVFAAYQFAVHFYIHVAMYYLGVLR